MGISILEARVREIEMEKQKLEHDKLEREKELHELQRKVENVPDGWKEKVSVVEMNQVHRSAEFPGVGGEDSQPGCQHCRAQGADQG